MQVLMLARRSNNSRAFRCRKSTPHFFRISQEWSNSGRLAKFSEV
ncbi:hypothetical protein BVRB_1g003540 [Beta vulgaris subsp. vulgaris]|nr:hypothetical protein BVRB_1g003540 [Beta vulgaris subsp. vulgaris]